MSKAIAPIVAEVTHTEAVQSGLNKTQGRTLSPAAKNSVNRFVKANLNQATAPETNPGVDQRNKNAAQNKPQVSSEEQAFAMASKGITRKQGEKENVSKPEKRYQMAFSTDRYFLEQDLRTFEDSLTGERRCLADKAINLSDKDKGLRKFLLAEIILEQPDLNPERRARVGSQRTELLAQFGEYIEGQLAAIDHCIDKKMSAVQTREIVRAYALPQETPTDDRNTEMMNLFLSLEKSFDKNLKSTELRALHNKYVAILNREKSQSPSRVTTTRQHLIISRIYALRSLIKLADIHGKFLKACTKAKLRSLPKPSELMKSCLQITMSNDMFGGVNSLIRLAAAVSGPKHGPGNMFITNYNRLILQSPQLKNDYKNPFHRRQVSDHFDKTVRTSGLITNTKQKVA